MTLLQRVFLQAGTDFVVTAGSSLTGYMVAKEAVVMPTPAMWLLAVILGSVGAARHVQAFLARPEEAWDGVERRRRRL